MTVKASIGQPTTTYATSSSSIPTPSVIVSNGALVLQNLMALQHQQMALQLMALCT